MLLDGFADAAEDDSLLAELLLEGGLHRHGVHDGVDGGAAEREPLFEGYAELVEGLLELGVYLVVLGLLGERVGIVGDGLVVYLRQMHVAPRGLGLGEPVAECLQAEVEQPLGLSLLLRDKAHHILVESLIDNICMHIGGKPELVLLVGHLSYKLIFLFVCH